MDDDFTPQGLGGTLDCVFHVFRVFQKRWKDFLAISLLVYLAGLIVAILTALLMGNDLKIDGFSIQPQFSVNVGGGNQTQTDNSSFYIQYWQLAAYLIEVLIYYCFSCIAHGASVWLATHLYLEQYPSILNGFSNAGTKVVSLAWSLILISMIAVVPCFSILAALRDYLVLAILLVCIVTGFLQVIFYHAYPVIMVENKGGLQALSRSFEISSGHRVYIFCILFTWGLIRSMIGLLIALISSTGLKQELTFNEDYMSWDVEVSRGWQYYFAQVLDTSFGIIFLALESVFQAVLYLRNRAANESLDRVGLASELGSTEDGDYITMTTASSSNEESRNDKNAKEDPGTLP
ncbi:unnamed protein product [Cylindrotheca closterium]|uniref:Uncharacterized protein n=1 Tax=Cylindrotheca closterium TaxID=2856 RepID=A0AAD2G2I3_9STRA|nr:unnamed protein product [Cylindrotheca closterium]